jgi:hypothetical protein
MLGGFFLTASGVAGEIVGTGLTTTGIGSLIGVPAVVVSAGLVASGAGGIAGPPVGGGGGGGPAGRKGSTEAVRLAEFQGSIEAAIRGLRVEGA